MKQTRFITPDRCTKCGNLMLGGKCKNCSKENNKIKVIDLYNMIANGEELPKRFECYGYIWNKAVVGDDWFNKNANLFTRYIDGSDLNEEIEILDNENYYIFSSYPDHVELDRDYIYEFKVREKNDTEGITCKKVRMKIVDWEDDYND